jgi:2,4-dichlorophenol 6-monooxygenase
MSRVDWRTSLGGEDSCDRRVIGSVPAFGGQVGTPAYEIYRRHSAELSSNIPNIVLVKVEDTQGEVTEYRAQYLVGADGRKLVGPKIGVQMEGSHEPSRLRQHAFSRRSFKILGWL